MLAGRERAQRDGDAEGQQKSDAHQQQCVGDALADHHTHIPPAFDRAAQVSFQHNRARPFDVLDVEGLVESHPLAQTLDLFLGDIGVALGLGQRATRSHPHESKEHYAQNQEQGDRLQRPADDVR